MKCVEKYDFCMDTVVYQRVYGKYAEEAVDEATKKLHHLESILSLFQSGSDIHLINHQAGKNWVKVSQDTLNVLHLAKIISARTNGAFDVTIGCLSDYWRQLRKNQDKPDKKYIEFLLDLVTYQDIQINPNEKVVKLKRPGQQIDLGGIGKGYAGEKIVDIYQNYSVLSGFINLGGNAVLVGKPPLKKDWKVGIRNPFSNDGKIFGAVRVKNRSVVTSGGYERYYEKEGFKYHHILDPRTGFPAETEWQSVTVISESSSFADALSTAIFVLNQEETVRLIEKNPSVEVIMVSKSRKIGVTRNIEKNFVKLDQEMSIMMMG